MPGDDYRDRRMAIWLAHLAHVEAAYAEEEVDQDYLDRVYGLLTWRAFRGIASTREGAELHALAMTDFHG